MLQFIHITNGDDLPEISTWKPFRALVIIECKVDPAWQRSVSSWLVQSGCLYMMAWGENCSSWDDSVDEANLEDFGYGEIPEDDLVMTTWHDSEPLEHTFFFAKHCAIHPSIKLPNLVLVYIGQEDKEDAYTQIYAHA